VRSEVVVTSLVLFTLVYALLFTLFIYLLNDKISHGPDESDLLEAGKLALPSHESNSI
jgi:cytochrome d ubiquinol oxidase subunit I